MPDYKSTLNLPKTDFAMKANLSQAEPLTVKRWQDEALYDTVQAARANAPLSMTALRTRMDRSTWGICSTRS